MAAEIEETFLHCASRRVRGSEREEKASARSGRNDMFVWVLLKDGKTRTLKSAGCGTQATSGFPITSGQSESVRP